MTAATTANQVNGQATGTLFFSGFGAIWLILARDQLSAEEMLCVALVAAFLVAAAFLLMRQARRLPRVAKDKRVSRMFLWINVGQWVLIFLLVISLNTLRMRLYTVTAVAVIVALHMFPLAWLFRYKLHYVTGGALLLWALGALFLVPEVHLQSTTALGEGAILWLSSAITLTLTYSTVRHALLAPTQTAPDRSPN
jgi:hypothetical protein